MRKAMTLRLPMDLAEWLEGYAKEMDRSINVQVVATLRQEKRRAEQKERYEHEKLS